MCWSSEGKVAIGGLMFFTAWFLIGLPWLTSPPERIQYYENTKAAPRPSAAEPKGSAQAPFFVQVIPTPKSAQERTEEAEERQEKREGDRWLVRWTAALFVATVGLILATGALGYFAYRQLKDMKASIAASQKAADAAKESADALVATERPYLFLKDIHIDRSGDHPHARFSIENLGRTPAILHATAIWIRAFRTLPDTPEYSDERSGQRRVIYQRDEMPDQWAHMAMEDREEYDAAPHAHRLYLIGYIRYADVFGKVRLTGRCFRFPVNALTEAIDLFGGDRYNYDTDE